jgi:predicted SAM-dependent methyltransferase
MTLEEKLASRVVRLNVCAGRQCMPDYVNVDVVASTHKRAKGPPDIFADMRSIPLPDGIADEVMCIHGIEHVVVWEADKALREWLRLLKPGGHVTIECPDLIKCCQNVLSGLTVPGKHPDQFGVWGLFGDYTVEDEHMTHRFAYSPASMRAKLLAAGFVDVREETPQWHCGGAVRRDMRLTARKPT